MRLALLGLLLSGPAVASYWEFESAVSKDRQALRAASEAAGSEARFLAQLALEPDKIPLLRKQVDLSVSAAGDAAARARSLDGRCQEAWTEADDAMRGQRRRPMPERSIVANSASIEELWVYWRRLNQELANIPPKGDLSARKQAEEDINAAKLGLERAESRTKTMREDLEKLQSRHRQLRSLKDDIQTAANQLGDASLAMQNLASPTKSRIEAIGTPPENENRTAASQKIEEFRSPSGTLNLAASTLLNRTDDFTRHWMSFEKTLQEFDALRDANDPDFTDARRRLDEAKPLIDQARSQAAQNQNNP